MELNNKSIYNYLSSWKDWIYMGVTLLMIQCQHIYIYVKSSFGWTMYNIMSRKFDIFRGNMTWNLNTDVIHAPIHDTCISFTFLTFSLQYAITRITSHNLGKQIVSVQVSLSGLSVVVTCWWGHKVVLCSSHQHTQRQECQWASML